MYNKTKLLTGERYMVLSDARLPCPAYLFLYLLQFTCKNMDDTGKIQSKKLIVLIYCS